MSKPIAKVRVRRTTGVPREEGPTPRILLLDDHAGSREVMRHLITMLGYECNAVGTAAALFASFEPFLPDAILYEWSSRNEQREGLGMRLRVLAKERKRRTALIVVSSIDEPDGFSDRELIDAYLTKPVRIPDLRAILRAYV